MKSSRWVLLCLGLLTLATDQTAKFWAESRFSQGLSGRQGLARMEAFFTPRPVQPPSRELSADSSFLRVRYVETPSGSWRLLPWFPTKVSTPLALTASVLALGFLVFMLMRLPQEQTAQRVGLAMVLGGALGNFLDRAVRGYTIDFVELRWQLHANPGWPTFNLADAATGLGVALVLVSLFRAQARSSELPSSPQWRPGALGPPS